MSEPEQNNINSEGDQNEEITIPVKKMRKFHAKEFRENLKTFNGLTCK